MAQWDVFPNPSPRMRDALPYVVVLQSDLLGAVGTRLVAPLARDLRVTPGITTRLSPQFHVGGELLRLVVHECAPIDGRALKQPVVSLKAQSHLLVIALDAVVSGV